MKKKLIIATALLLLIAICTSMFVGCDEIFKKNDKRDALQVVATVKYTGELGTQTENVYKFELAASFNSYAYYYVNYYGMTYEATANYLAQSIAQQRLLTLYAIDKLATLQGMTSIPTVDKLLSRSELNKAVEDTNESLLNSLISTVESLITEDNANASTTEKDDDKDIEIDEETSYTVRFESNGGSTVDKQKVNHNAKATEPSDPTKDGYTFYGWYDNADFAGEEFDFDTRITSKVTLYAKWAKYLAPRTELPEAEEEDDYDADDNSDSIVIADKFFDASYKAQLLDDTSEDSLFTTKFLNSDFASKVDADDKVQALKGYVNEGLAELSDALKESLYRDSVEDCYNYYLNSQYTSLVVARLERKIGEGKEVSDEEVRSEFESAVAQNKETFAGSSTSYESALTSSLNKTYYHPADDQGYGFVINILFKLDDESMDILKDMATSSPTNVEAILLERNRLISNMSANVSNPNYDADAVVEDANGNEIELRDPMTDANNPYNNVGKVDYDHSKQYEVSTGVYNDYNQILSFEKVDGEYQIVFRATEHPAMAYLMDKWPVFDTDTQVGLIHQIHKSLDQVKTAVANNELTKEQGVYWLREVATTWAYLVSDDSGATSSDSNNNGLGYLVSPEGKDTSFLADFTNYARKLIANGTGSYSNGTVTDDSFKGANEEGVFEGNNNAFVIADSLVTDGVASTSNSNAYAGVFVLLNSLTVWDETMYDGTLPTDNILPLDYILTYGKDADSTKTVRDIIYDSILEAKKSDSYNLEINTMASNNKDNIEYFDKVIKQLWEDLV